MKRCLIYARVSTKQQTTENQLPPLRKFAKERGWIVIQVLIDHGYSGTTENRPNLIELMAMARHREFDVLLVYALDRFGGGSSAASRSRSFGCKAELVSDWSDRCELRPFTTIDSCKWKSVAVYRYATGLRLSTDKRVVDRSCE